NVFSRSFTLTVLPGSNQPPAISLIADRVINEDTASGLIMFIVGDAETPAANLLLSATSSNPGLIPPGNIFLGGNGANRTVNLVPSANQFGTAIIALTVKDSAASASTSFALTVNSVNDPPTLNPLNSLTLAQGAGEQTVPFSGVSAGQPNENQTLNVTAVSSNPDLIPTPLIHYTSPASAGTLTFTPTANTNGSAVITVTAQDDGGVANGGQDSFSQTFNVTIVP